MRAFGHSIDGLVHAWRTQGAFRQEVIALAILLPVALLIEAPPLERVLLVASVLLVMMVELLNSSIEAAIDRVSLSRHPLSKVAKDTASAAVLLSVVIALGVWAAVIAPRLLA